MVLGLHIRCQERNRWAFRQGVPGVAGFLEMQIIIVSLDYMQQLSLKVGCRIGISEAEKTAVDVYRQGILPSAAGLGGRMKRLGQGKGFFGNIENVLRRQHH